MATNNNIKIFIVDDDALCLNLYHQFLRNLGYSHIELFDNGADCLENIPEEEPDIIFLDYNMEGMNGMEVMKEIKKIDPGILVYFISGQEEIDVALNTIKSGAVDYIVKSTLNPERMKEIMQKAETLVSSHGHKKEKKSFFKRFIS